MKGIISVQSHVVYGHAGNSSAVFPLQRMGLEVWPIHTVQYSNHTQYAEGFRGVVFSALDIEDIIHGLRNIGTLEKCHGVITGYQGSVQQCEVISNLVERVKMNNPMALYVCDPVMGSPEKGCIVNDGIKEALIDTLMPMADVIIPNQYELSQFANMEINTLSDAVEACSKAISKGPKIVLVKHLHSIPEAKGKFTMMLAYDGKFYLTQCPHVDFKKSLVGVGDLISAVFTGGLLRDWSVIRAFKHCNEAVYGIVNKTKELKEWELQTIEAQNEIVSPSNEFVISKCFKDRFDRWTYEPI
ncbi:pyridoxal kinase PdxY [Vibrio parahaemolyticus]|uniref:pyridoxal kinase PdxY n=1 Tax=Vibrio parahaemolyticus TaxID=670 RepID=UPI00040C8F81|nr:pyridoxal kinase PdxY [Vibrio parahaemolyticus]MBE3895543.1 pyridoxal kinase PdxY [Vibrio parahaemolyticus]